METPYISSDPVRHIFGISTELADGYGEAMGKDARSLLAEALALEDGDRADLAAELLASLDDPTFDSQEDVDRLWATEIERRSNRDLSGGSRGESRHDVRSRIEADLAARQSADQIAGHPSHDLWYDATTVGADHVVETWISHGPRSTDSTFDPQPGDGVTVGDDEEPPMRGRVTRRDGNRVWVQLELVATDAAPHEVGHG